MTADEVAKRLAEPFAANEIEWRVQSSGKTARGPWVRVLAYVTNRAIMDRLDAVCGPAGWKNEYTFGPPGVLMCGISIYFGDPIEEWVTKYDGAGEPSTSGGLSEGDATKGGFSNAMKRAAVQWGIGRYLYHLEEGYAIIASMDDREAEYLKENSQKHGPALKWRPPVLPAWALPGGNGKPLPIPPRAERTVAQRDAAATVNTKATASAIATLVLPGTKAHFDGHGGKRIADVPRDALPAIKEVLTARNGEGKYTIIIDAIDLTLDAARVD